ncbi:caspase recruitment domain-containing protein 19 isoform X4 [Strigops habroptila]|uniref:caspase recruitment domain-containing protein 19 isoform X4 n=1 Tax=Strigops habroptila TaxID=2489341 RepID=UPI0011D01807|nr:caspase recruitment domain-containing protein 19 isoform X4 [Strigops habroptila]
MGRFSPLVCQKPEGSSLCGLGRDFSELEERQKISEERNQSYCHRLQHDMYFLTSNSRLNEQVVDKIILQLNRVYPQILTNAEAEKFRNPKASLHTRLSDLIKHLQKKGERHCQEFYRALQISAEQLYNDLPSRKVLTREEKKENKAQLSLHTAKEDHCCAMEYIGLVSSKRNKGQCDHTRTEGLMFHTTRK